MTSKNKQLSASLEDYLETIFWIASDNGVARAKDIAQKLNVKAGSVTGALQMLSKTGHINYAPYEVITLTEKGKTVAQEVIKKHETLKNFFVEILGITDTIAEDGACKMEHSVPDEIISRLIMFSQFVKSCPTCGKNWIEKFQEHCNNTNTNDKCLDCQENCTKENRSENNLETNISRSILSVEPGSKCVVQSVKRGASASKRLAEMGISRGTVIEVERVAPLGDPIEIKVKGYHLSIRKNEAENIIVE